jgi:subtilisin family serine protease
VALSMVLAPAMCLSTAPAVAAPGTPRPMQRSDQQSVTLITGDRVTVDANGSVSVAVGAGRRGVSFSIFVDKGHRYVIPSDAQPLLDRTVDRRLFDVTALVDFKYDDAHRADVPLIIDQGQRGLAALRSVQGLSVRPVRLARAGASAARLAKSQAGSLWQQVTSGAFAGRKVWLDAVQKLSLDRSVPEIGAPEAWKAGYTGTGVKVAVVDSGIDATHPDLVGQVVGEKNFTDDPSNGDAIGHGTHVASTIASSGANLNGKYTGVAPGAKLLDAKVCTLYTCEDSAILAGMQWAVDQGAKVVNMSLGSGDLPGPDPLEEAVNSLSAQHGTLFVVAAGNDAPYGSISSPGVADAALTVGAVDRNDVIAPFSSRGPRLDGGMIKPDITAPGVRIVAAQATGSTIGAPGPDPGYQALSGTSMATPHVAGSAALLAQEHPDWTGERIKAALMESAKPTGNESVYDQGAGRVTVNKAVALPVTAKPASIDFGLAKWPHTDDKPLTSTVTYSNTGDKPVTLTASVDATGPDGKPAPDGFFTVAPSTVTVPAGGDATVTMAANTKVGTENGLFQGAIVLTGADGTALRTPVAVQREAESYDLHLVYIGADGQPNDRHSSDLTSLTTPGGWPSVPGSVEGKATMRVPRGEDMLWTTFYTDSSLAVVVNPELMVDHDQTVVVDARNAKPIKITVPEDQAAKEFGAAFMIKRSTTTGAPGPSLTEAFPEGFGGSRQVLVGQSGPDAPKGGIEFSVNDLWVGGDRVHPQLYSLGWNQPSMPDGFSKAVKLSSLAKVDEALPASNDRLQLELDLSSPLRKLDLFGFSFTPEITGAKAVTTYFTTTAAKALWETRYRWINDSFDATQIQTVPFTGYRPGRTYQRHDGYPVYGPVVSGAYAPGDAWRVGDQAYIFPGLFGDSAGNRGWFPQKNWNGVLTRVDKPGTIDMDPMTGLYKMAPEPGVYRYDVSADRQSGDLSTSVSGSWTFRSAHAAETEAAPLPLPSIRFVPKISDTGDAPAGQLFVVPLVVQSQPGTPVSRIDRITVEVSYDDGATWTKAPVAFGAAYLRHPDAAGYVSLRASGTDQNGNSETVTIIHAYRLVKS